MFSQINARAQAQLCQWLIDIGGAAPLDSRSQPMRGATITGSATALSSIRGRMGRRAGAVAEWLKAADC